MSKVGKRWTAQENAQLAKLYNEDLLDINDIAKIHERNPLGIAARLVTLKIINHILDARGHPNPELNSTRPNDVKKSAPMIHPCTSCATYLETISSIQKGHEIGINTLKTENSKLQQEIVDLQRRIYGMCTEIRSMNGSKTADERKNPILKNPIQPMKMTTFNERNPCKSWVVADFLLHAIDNSSVINKKEIPYKSHADLIGWTKMAKLWKYDNARYFEIETFHHCPYIYDSWDEFTSSDALDCNCIFENPLLYWYWDNNDDEDDTLFDKKKKNFKRIVFIFLKWNSELGKICVLVSDKDEPKIKDFLFTHQYQQAIC